MANFYVTVAGAGAKDGSDWANAFDYAAFDSDFHTASAGDCYYLKSGTYTLTSNLGINRSGTNTSKCKIIGVTSATTAEPPTSSDWATGDDRPLIACGASYKFVVLNYWQIRNLRFTGSGSENFDINTYCHVENVKSENSGSGSAISIANHSIAIDCEAVSTSGTAVILNEAWLHGCDVHDSSVGVDAGTFLGGRVTFCNIWTCTTGINCDVDAIDILNCNIHDCTTGLDINIATGGVKWINCNIANCTTAVDVATSAYVGHFSLNNNYYNNTADGTNLVKTDSDIAADPGWTDADSGDFSTGANIEDAGFPGEFPSGGCTGYLNIGSVQSAEGSGGGAVIVIEDD